MIFADRLPSELTKQLYDFSDWFFSQSLQDTITPKPKNLDTQYAVGAQYLELMKARPDNVGFPEECYGAEIIDFDDVEDCESCKL